MNMVANLRFHAGQIALIILAFIAAALWWQASHAHSQAKDSGRTLEECRQLARQIRALQTGPQAAELTQRPVEELSQLVESWTKQAGIAPDRLLRVEPQAPRRVGDTDYLEQGAKVELRDVTLFQLAKLADNVRRDEEQLRLADLRLIAPRQEAKEAGEETWQVELVLSSLLYAPKTAHR